METLDKIYPPILRLALPLIIIQLCQASLGLVDTLIAGQFHYRDLAGVGLGSNMWTPVFILFTGILYVLVPKFSASASTGQLDQIKTIFCQGKNIAHLLSVLGFILIHLLAWASPLLLNDPLVAEITSDYLHLIAFGIPGLVYMLLYRFVGEGNSQLKPIMLTGIILLVINTLLSYLFVNGISFNGNVLFSPMGGSGCGLATAISAYIALFVLRSLVAKAVPQLNEKPPIDKQYSSSIKMLKAGFPIGISLILQLLAITTLAFFAASLGVKVVAAHQILINIAMVIVMIPVALGSATTIRIAHFHANKEFKNKQRTGLAAMLIAALYGGTMAFFLWIFGPHLITPFSQDMMVLNIAAGLIIYTAFFQFFDTIQMVAAGILRGLEEFVKPLQALLISYWLIILPLSYVFGVKGWWLSSPHINHVWLILATGISFAAILLSLQSYRYLKTG